MLLNLESPHKSHYAFDWSTGLLYFTEVHTIWVVDLKQPVALSETGPSQTTYDHRLLKVYQSKGPVTISGLIVRPDNSSLIWLEYSTISGTRVDIMQASQAGKDVSKLVELNKRVESLVYDYFLDRFMVLLAGSVEQEHNGFIFKYKDINDIEKWYPFKIKTVFRMGESLFLYGDWVLFVLHQGVLPAEQKITSIVRWNIFGGKEVSPRLVSKDRFNNQTFTVIDDTKRIHPPVDSRCGEDGEQSVCSQLEFDFCIPHNETTFICKSNVSVIAL